MNLVKGNLATIVPKSQVLSLKTAYIAVGDKLMGFTNFNAEIVSLLSRVDFSKYLKPNLKFDESINKMRLDELLSTFSTTRGVIPADGRVISQGDMVTNDNYLILESLRQAYLQKRSYDGWVSYSSFGQMILIGALLIMLVVYLQSFNPQLFWQKRNFSLILTTLIITFAMTRLVVDNQEVNLYLLPVCILPIIIRTFLGARNAIFIHLIAVLIIGFLAPNSFEYVFLQSIVGALAVISLNKFHKRGHLVITALLLVGAYSVLYFGFELVKEGDIEKINWNEFKWFAGNGLLLLIAYPLIYVFEKIFGLISDVTLMELSDTNHPLLRLLSETAPGTFQHSMQVANLAEEVIRRTGGNPMLVRTGALYHDVGKILDAQYFIENQSPGENPHDKLPYKKSAEKIINHINDGVALARKYKIPEIIIDFVRMHHGRSQARYFYLKYKQAFPNEKIDMEEFMYPGPNPDSRETAVVMLADGVEAASRSLPEKNEETLKNIIDQIIDTRIQNRDLDSSPLTFKDIIDIKAIFLEKLKIVYHLRIQYPEEKD
jgi:putative nucleotidyltransferase with HDIG domain